MPNRCCNYSRLATVVAYALAMAWVESAVVFYLRTMIDRIDPYQPNPLPIIGGLGPVELVREAATLAMLLTVGMLAGRTWRARLGYATLAFGVWDIFYYVFLKVMCGWPHSLLDWDILFLLPLPWWGPVLAPMCIAGLMIIWGTLATREDNRDPAPGITGSSRAERWKWLPWVLNWLGICLALYVFMRDTLRVSRQGVDTIRKLLPEHFAWPLFSLALLLMSAPLFALCGRGSRPSGRRHAAKENAGWTGDCSEALE